MTRFPAPDPPYEGPAAHTSAGHNKPILRIVVHSTVSPCEPGGRHDIARYFRSEASGGSAQYVTDPVGVVQVVYDDQVAWGAPGAAWSRTSHPQPASVHSLHVEMCDIPGPVPGDRRGSAAFKAARRVWRWRRPNQQAMLHVTAQLVAQLCLAYDVPAAWLGPAQLLNGRPGVTSHANVSRTFHQSTHWDPGFWPRRRFMRLVRNYMRTERNR